MLCPPLGREQPDNAKAVVRLGAGIQMEPTAEPEAITAAVRDLVSVPGYAIAAKQVSACFVPDDEPALIDVELEQLIQSGVERRTAR